MTKKQPTRQRIERAVTKAMGDKWGLYGNDAVRIVLAERRRIRREVNLLRKANHYRAMLNDMSGMAYEQACDDILAALQQGGKK